MRYHMKFQEYVAMKSVLIDLTFVYSLRNSCHCGLAVRGFNGKWAWSKNFRARLQSMPPPPNLQHLPMPVSSAT